MEKQQVAAFKIVGIAVRTTNENQQAAIDIPALWGRFMAEQVLERIPNKVDSTIYCVYTDYEKDHTKPYSTILGCKVSSSDAVPEGMVLKEISAGDYQRQTVKGNLMQGPVVEAWMKIWNSAIPRIYTADFEVYGPTAQDPTNGEMEIYLAV